MLSMHTMLMVYNNCGLVLYVMNQSEPTAVKSEAENKVPVHQTFFPRIIREFDDGPDEKPMVYRGE